MTAGIRTVRPARDRDWRLRTIRQEQENWELEQQWVSAIEAAKVSDLLQMVEREKNVFRIWLTGIRTQCRAPQPAGR